ncbi:MAG: hypothetical protein ABFS35_23890, partial [Bacteroidota bacterium]
MGRIVTLVNITNLKNPDYFMRCDALVDTGASYLFLPTVWKERLGDLDLIRTVELKTSTQDTVDGEVYGPVQIQLEGFCPIYNEVVFVDMHPKDGFYEPLIESNDQNPTLTTSDGKSDLYNPWWWEWNSSHEGVYNMIWAEKFINTL